MRSNEVGALVALPCLDEEKSVGQCVREAIDGLAAATVGSPILGVRLLQTAQTSAWALALMRRINERRHISIGSSALPFSHF